MKAILSSAVLFSTLFSATVLRAAPLNFKVTGMHCGACKAMIEKEICSKGGFESCEASLTDTKNQIGELKIETKAGQTADASEIMKRIEKLGYKAEPVTPKKK